MRTTFWVSMVAAALLSGAGCKKKDESGKAMDKAATSAAKAQEDVREQAKDRTVPEPRREGKASAQYNPAEDYLAEECQQLYLSRKADPVPLGNRPLIVLGAGKRPAPPGTSDSLWRVLRTERDEQVRDLARLSRNSKFVLDSASGHGIPQDNPQLVARSIREVLKAASRGARLAP